MSVVSVSSSFVPEADLARLVASMAPALDDVRHVFVTLPDTDHVPGELTPVATMREDEGLSLVLDAEQAERHRLDGTFPCARITLRVHSALEAVGLLAAVTGALTEAGISANAVAAFHHDHLFVPWSRRHDAMDVLRGLADAPIS